MNNFHPYVPIAGAIIGALLGSFLGFLWSLRSDKRKDKKLILVTIMAYRGVGAADHDWIKALNMVDIVFYDNKKVREKLHEYFRYLHRPLFETGHHQAILIDLIHEMVKDIGYKRLKQTDIMDYYFPVSMDQLYPIATEKNEPSGNSPS